MTSKSKKPTLPEAPKPTPVRTPGEEQLVRDWAKRQRAHRQRVPDMENLGDGKIANADGDSGLFLAQVAAITGVDDYLHGQKLISDTSAAVPNPDPASRFHLAAAGIDLVAPRDGIEAMLAAQMTATHFAAMRFLGEASKGGSIELTNARGNLAVKLLRTFTAQVEALSRHRSGGKQQVTVVHQHVHVTAEQAAVAINSPAGAGGPGGSIENESQPDAIAHSRQLEVRSADPDREAVSVPRDGER